MKKITPDINLQNEIQKSKILESRDFYKGKSFRFVHEWHPGTNYFNDQFNVDFITFNNTLLACKKSHKSSNEDIPVIIYDAQNPLQPIGVESNYWEFVLGGIANDIDLDLSNYYTKDQIDDTFVSTDSLKEYATKTEVEGKQNQLVSGTNIKTINGESILGSGNIEIKVSPEVDLSEFATKQWIEDKGYLTEVPSQYVTKNELTSSIADWDATDGNSFIKNKTHSKTPLGSSATLVWKDFDDGTIIVDNIPINATHVETKIPDYNSTKMFAIKQDEIINMASSGPNFNVLVTRNNDDTLKMVCKNSDKRDVYFYMVYYNVVPLDNIYLPDTIITTENIKQLTLDGGETNFIDNGTDTI